MWKCLKCVDMKKTGIFAAGVLFGTAGIKLLSSKDAKKFYTNCTAASRSAHQRIHDEDGDFRSGKCRGYLRRGEGD